MKATTIAKAMLLFGGVLATPRTTIAQVPVPEKRLAETSAIPLALEECKGTGTIIGVALGTVVGAVAGYHFQRYASNSGGEDPGLAGLLLGAVVGGVGGGYLGSRVCASPRPDSRLSAPQHERQLWRIQAGAIEPVLKPKVPAAAEYLMVRSH